MTQPPPGQGPIDPHGVFSPPPAPGSPGSPGMPPPGYFSPPMMPMMMPPPPGYMMPPPPRGRSFARAIFMTLATTIFGISLLLNLYLLAFSGLLHARDSQQTDVIQKGDLTNRIAVLTLDGIINEKAAEQFRKQLKTLSEDATVKALVVQVDSPGGSVTASDEIYHALMNYKLPAGKSPIPVVISQGSLAASGGYYVSCAGDYIVAQPSTLTGNIGVLLERFNVSKLMDKWGIEDSTLKSIETPFKGVESPTIPSTPATDAYLQTIVEDAYTQFCGVVKAGRATAIAAKGAKVEEIANGKIYTADQAFKLGLVDKIDYPEAAYAVAASRAGLGAITPTVFKVKDTPGLLDLLGARAGLGEPNAGAGTSGVGEVEVNGMKVNAAALYQLLSPRLMYLWTGQ